MPEEPTGAASFSRSDTVDPRRCSSIKATPRATALRVVRSGDSGASSAAWARGLMYGSAPPFAPSVWTRACGQSASPAILRVKPPDRGSRREPELHDIVDQATQYLILVTNKDNAHYEMAAILRRRHWRLGVPVIITTTIVSTAIFTTLTKDTAIGWRVATGLISVVAAVLAALQTFFGFADQAQRHVEAA